MGAFEYRASRRYPSDEPNDVRARFSESFCEEAALVLGTALLIIGWFLPVKAGNAFLIWRILLLAMDAFGPI